MKQLGLSDFLELKTRRENGEQIKEYKSEFLGGSIMVKKIKLQKYQIKLKWKKMQQQMDLKEILN